MARREVLVQLDDELVESLDEIAQRLGISRSALIRMCAKAFIQDAQWADADRRLAEAYREQPEDPAWTEALTRIAVENWPE